MNIQTLMGHVEQYYGLLYFSSPTHPTLEESSLGYKENQNNTQENLSLSPLHIPTTYLQHNLEFKVHLLPQQLRQTFAKV